MDSIPPATMTPYSPAAICDAASMTALSPEPQTLLIVVQGMLRARPAPRDAPIGVRTAPRMTLDSLIDRPRADDRPDARGSCGSRREAPAARRCDRRPSKDANQGAR